VFAEAQWRIISECSNTNTIITCEHYQGIVFKTVFFNCIQGGPDTIVECRRHRGINSTRFILNLWKSIIDKDKQDN